MLSIKHFSELTSSEFYDIAQVREKVFLLEQHIVCQDFDGVDKRAVHIMIREGEEGAPGGVAGSASPFFKSDTICGAFQHKSTGKRGIP